jgi:hypothetical protein
MPRERDYAASGTSATTWQRERLYLKIAVLRLEGE